MGTALEMQNMSPNRDKDRGDNEDTPLLLSSSSDALGLLKGAYRPPASNRHLNNLHLSQQVHQQYFFPEGTFYRNLFANSSRGRELRLTLSSLWGAFSIVVAFTFLKVMFGYSFGRSFFVAATTLTTIGYGPSLSPSDNRDHDFLSAYFLFCVFPFVLLQLVCTLDMVSVEATTLEARIATRMRRGTGVGAGAGMGVVSAGSSTAGTIVGTVTGAGVGTGNDGMMTARAALTAEFRSAVVTNSLLMGILLLVGTLQIRLFADDQNWTDGVFYSVATATTIGYGAFEVKNELGYLAIGSYALLCTYTVSVVFSRIVAFLPVIQKNCEAKPTENALSDRSSVVREVAVV